MALGKTIEQLRKRKGLTQAQLAAHLDLHPSVITRWEKRQVQPRAKVLDKLAEVLEVSVEELMAGEYGALRATFREVNDPDLTELLSQLHRLDDSEREALKVFLKAMLARAQMEEVMQRLRPTGSSPSY